MEQLTIPETHDAPTVVAPRPLRIVDLLAGTRSGTEAFTRRGHLVLGVDLTNWGSRAWRGDIHDLTGDQVRDWMGGPIDFVWASPPCQSFTVARMGTHWEARSTCRSCDEQTRRVGKPYGWEHLTDDALIPSECASPSGSRKYKHFLPRTDKAASGLALLESTLRVCHEIAAPYWMIENPVGLMRRMPPLAEVERRTVTYCQYGDPRRMKPTDLFGIFPPTFNARRCGKGDDCHEAAPRGSKTGTQGLPYTERTMQPYGLTDELCDAVEHARFGKVVTDAP